MIAVNDLEWMAGFLEAEGCFHYSKSKHLNVSAGQVQAEPLERLQVMLGGGLGKYVDSRGHANDIHRWSAVHSRAAGIMMTLYPLMSPKRQAEICRALDGWKSQRPAQKLRTHCLQGHPLSGDNLYMHGDKRYCRTCRGYESAIERGWRKAPTWQNRRPGEKINFQCKRGHSLEDKSNLYLWRGKRYCIACRRLKKSEFDEKQRQERLSK